MLGKINIENLKYIFSRGYNIDKDGNIINPKGKRLRGFVDEKVGGYRIFTVRKGKKTLKTKVHFLAAYQKFGDMIIGDGIQIRHKNNNKLDNSYNNLLLGTASENYFDRPPEERKAHAKIAASYLRKLTDEQVKNLREDRLAGMKYADLATKYSLSKSTVSYIVNNKTYN